MITTNDQKSTREMNEMTADEFTAYVDHCRDNLDLTNRTNRIHMGEVMRVALSHGRRDELGSLIDALIVS
jgi:hypothetical protein